MNFERFFKRQQRVENVRGSDDEIYLPFLIVVEGISIHKVDGVIKT
jgi:hypothetical protein